MKLKTIFLYITLCFILTQFSMSLYLPSAFDISRFFNIKHHTILILLPLLIFGYAFGQLSWGMLSDRFGRKYTLLTALLLHLSLDIIVCFFVHSFIIFSLLLILIGFMAAALTAVTLAIIKDIHPGKAALKPLASIEVVMSSAVLLSMWTGAHLASFFHWQAVFLLLAIFAAVLAILTYWKLPETHHNHLNPSTPSPQLSVCLEFLKHPEFSAYLLSLGLMFGVFMTYLNSATFIFVKHFDLSMQQYSWIFVACTLTYIIGALINRHFIPRFGSIKMVYCGLFFTVIGSLLLIIVNHSLMATLAATALLMLGLGILLPATKAGAMTVFEKNNGTAAALMKFSQSILCVGVISIASNLQQHLSLSKLFSFIAIITIVVCVLFIFISRRKSIVTS